MPQQTINTPRDTTFKTTENTPRNLADAIAEELHGIAQALDPTADDYDDLSNKPQVNGVTLSGNKTSKQLGIRQTVPLTSAQYAQLSSAEKMDIDKDYIITDANGTIAPIDDDSVSRNKVWSSYKVDDELDTLNSKIAQTDGVSVNLSSSKTLQTSLNELFALIDQTKIKYSTKFIYNYGGGSYSALSLMYVASNTYEFSQAETSSSGVRALVAYIRNTGSGMYQNIGATYNDLTNTYGINGRSFEIHY